MGVIETKAFKSGNSVAVRLPSGLGVTAGTLVRIERVGSKLMIVPVFDQAAEKARMRTLIDEIEAIWAEAPYHAVEERAPIEFPIRPGL